MTSDRNDVRARMAQAVLLIVTTREQAPRSPAMERALKRLIRRYNRAIKDEQDQSDATRPPTAFEQWA